MTITIEPSGAAHLEHRTKRLATLWRLERTDGDVQTFTNHDKNITFDSATTNRGLISPDVRVYTPVGGFDGSAKRRETGLKAQNLDFKGIISSSAITVDDLRAGRYRGADLQEFVVDHRYPFKGAIVQNKYTVQDALFNGEFWSALLAGTAHKFASKTGELFSKFCPFEVFEFGGVRNCRKDSAGYNRANVAVNAVTSRRVFTATTASLPFPSGVVGVPNIDAQFFPLADPDKRQGLTGWFGHGKVTWLTGANIGIVSEVRIFKITTLTFELHIPTPFNIVAGDTFDAQAGCDKEKATCIQKFLNLVNFGGFSFLVGPKEAIQTVDSVV